MATPGAASESKDLIRALVKVLADDREFSGTEISETLWLALQMQPVAVRGVNEPQSSAITTDDEELPADQTVEELDISALPPPPETKPAPKVDLATPAPKAGVLPPDVLPVWMADPAMLTDSLAVIRALRPLLQQVEAGTGRRLNEAATVDRIARTRLWLPVLELEREPWFDIILVVDRGSSMAIWGRLVDDLVRILRRYGIFRDLQVFEIAFDSAAEKTEDAVRLRSHPDRPGHRPSELIEQRGRRIAIVLSDCAGQYWWDGSLLPMLQAWAKVMPTVVWQMLPEWMWERTALGRGAPVALSNGVPGAANQQLMMRWMQRQGPEDAGHRVAAPVVTSEVRDLANWSLMLAGDRREVTPGFLLPQGGGRVPKARSIEEIARDRVAQNGDLDSDADLEAAIVREIEGIARDRVQRFRQLSSPQSRRLVMLLAAAPVITLPVMRLIRDSMMDGARSPLPVAEVFLSGLLKRLSGPEETELDRVQYDFVPKVREVLLQVLPEVDTIEVINSVSAAVEERWNQYSTKTFRAFLTNPQVKAPEGWESLRSFASVTADILEPLGGDYASFAQDLRRGAGKKPVPDEPGGEEAAFPPLQTLDYETAQIELDLGPDKAGPDFPPIQTRKVEVVTIALNAITRLEVESFSFEEAKIERGFPFRQWTIRRRRRQARRYTEPLGNRVLMEMVAIPAGSFVMGSPKDEPSRSSNEGPQHTVEVGGFYMGRYPVTQGQWKAVAGFPQVNQSLDPDPSHFKGENHPVEQVSWHDAVEFCARLSEHTGREYRLPTEAEWEYACRAGTKTPFHFGEMIKTDVANYSGNYTYADGPKGRRRGKTTPVDQFQVGNAFGLSDMHGNVWEWCLDHWHGNYKGAPTDGSAWLTDKWIGKINYL